MTTNYLINRDFTVFKPSYHHFRQLSLTEDAAHVHPRQEPVFGQRQRHRHLRLLIQQSQTGEAARADDNGEGSGRTKGKEVLSHF